MNHAIFNAHTNTHKHTCTKTHMHACMHPRGQSKNRSNTCRSNKSAKPGNDLPEKVESEQAKGSIRTDLPRAPRPRRKHLPGLPNIDRRREG